MSRGPRLADLIDAAEVPVVADLSYGDSGSSDYTTVAYVTGVGKGATFTPVGGDTSKRLFIPNAGWRDTYGGIKYHGTHGIIWSATQQDASSAYRVHLYSAVTSNNNIKSVDKRDAYSLRCVRS